MDNLRRLEQIENIPGTRHYLRDRSNPMENLDDNEFHHRFRYSKDTVSSIMDMIQNDVSGFPGRGANIPPILKLLASLRFFATGSFQSVTGDLLHISQTSVSRIVREVAKAIAAHHQEFIKFPTPNEMPTAKYKFSQIGGLPGVIGTIDCTHVKIRFPGGPNSELYRNRKGYFSVNVQAVCSHDLKFTNIVARWPGSVHDSRIFRNSRLCAKFENNEYNGILLGDSGYALKPYLLTPILNPQTPPERRYNFAHCRTRNTVERLFGVWKRRFACLATGLRVKVQTVLVVIVALAILHNIARMRNDVYSDDDDDDDDSSDDDSDSDNDNDVAGRQLNANRDRLGNTVRRNIIQQYFTNV